ncbi:hypothetical protein GH714_009647 [Hevea brasiliensis]|uniref:Uncharacterized protein n=1 Tax=Hevea brasiliensis TaxID=3981 RepID=A0A6A6MEK8_HEVBR|nr:hypothetical protein GH714_009647 [Hevea brasiliensis]
MNFFEEGGHDVILKAQSFKEFLEGFIQAHVGKKHEIDELGLLKELKWIILVQVCEDGTYKHGMLKYQNCQFSPKSSRAIAFTAGHEMGGSARLGHELHRIEHLKILMAKDRTAKV